MLSTHYLVISKYAQKLRRKLLNACFFFFKLYLLIILQLSLKLNFRSLLWCVIEIKLPTSV